MKSITTLIVRDKKFYIVKQGDMYCAIDSKYVDADGKLTQALNGLQMHADKDLNKCLNNAKACAECDYYVSQGYTKADAFAKALGIELTEEAKALLNA